MSGRADFLVERRGFERMAIGRCCTSDPRRRRQRSFVRPIHIRASLASIALPIRAHDTFYRCNGELPP
jgi:hypothetical protein